MREVVEGHDAVQEAGVRYLPKLQDQDDDEYLAYKGRATFFNATGRVVDTMAGIIFRKDPSLSDDTGMQDIIEDVTQTGVPLFQFCENIVKDLLAVNRTGVLVDFPNVAANPPRTAMQAQASGIRVYARTYSAEDIINWRTETVGGKVALSLVVLREFECTTDPKDKFCVEVQEVYRVLEMVEGQYRQSLWKSVKGDKGTSTLQEVMAFTPVMDGKPMDAIPFEFFSSKGSEPGIEPPLLYDLAMVNLAHYRNDADREHGLHFTGLPTAVITGIGEGGDDTYRIGSSKAWVFSNSDANAFYLEFKGEGLGALRTSQKDKEEQMAALGARMLAPEKKDAESADTIANKRQGETSLLGSLANNVSRGVTRILRLMAQWQKAGSDKVSVKLNTDYTVTEMPPAQVSALLQAVMAGKLSEQSFYEALIKGEVIEGTRTFEEEKALIDQQGEIAPAVDADEE